MGRGATEHPTAAVHVQDGGQRSTHPDRLDDADPRHTDVRRHIDLLLGHVRLGYRRGLDVVEDLARTVGTEFVEERRLCRGGCELLSRRFEEMLGPDGSRPFGVCLLASTAVVAGGPDSDWECDAFGGVRSRRDGSAHVCRRRHVPRG